MSETGRAFPVSSYHGGVIAHGMTLRDYFAAKAMQSYIDRSDGDLRGYDDQIAKESYEMADAMLRACDG